MLQQRAAQLEQLIAMLEQGGEAGAAAALLGSAEGEAEAEPPAGAGLPNPFAGAREGSADLQLMALQLSLLAGSAAPGVPAVRPPSSGGTGGSGGSGGSGGGVPAMAQRQTRTQEAIASQFGVLREGSAVAAAAAMLQQQQMQMQQSDGIDHLMSCTAPGCRRCAWLLKLQASQGVQGAAPAQQPQLQPPQFQAPMPPAQQAQPPLPPHTPFDQLQQYLQAQPQPQPQPGLQAAQPPAWQQHAVPPGQPLEAAGGSGLTAEQLAMLTQLLNGGTPQPK